MEKRLFGLTTVVLRKLAYQLAEKNGKTHNFNHVKKIAGIDWLKGFMKRHPDLSIRRPEATSAARAMGFNKVAVNKFYSLLGEVYDKYNLTPDRIYNCDETGISCVSKTKSKIIAEKGRKQVGSLSSAERGQTVTVEICFNAAGTYMPPMLIFPRQRMKQELLDRAPPGTTAECNARGWMTTETFMSWFQRFVIFSGVSITKPVLLLLDGHVTHTQNIEQPSSTVNNQQPLPPPLEPILPAVHQETPISEPQSGPSMQQENSVSRSPIRRVCRDLTTSFENASPKDILPIPTVEQRNQTRKNYRRGKTVVLTSTPYKNELEEREQLKRTKKCSSPTDHGYKKNSMKQRTQKARSEGENVKEDALCIYCVDSNHTYLKSSEHWVACQLCGQWAHTACAGVDDADLEEIHICLFCDK
ncbi:unnamed protein product [Danaus chrysippus]|uniref:(African queen) hypothetical protein n=1 Tax=Danaus chrysippus TaxID=151541 RepID=A0A8J2QEZ8_9NEOP|nr:unnamed protein product [Danaus chrysippus]